MMSKIYCLKNFELLGSKTLEAANNPFAANASEYVNMPFSFV